VTQWNSNELSKRFLHQAQEAERYLGEVRGKLKQSRAYEHVFDEHMARFYVFNYLHGRTFLETPGQLVAELGSMNRGEIPHDREVFDKARFERHYRAYIEQVMQEISGKM
jgi:hypothetical protein